MEKSDQHILQNSFFCVPLETESDTGLSLASSCLPLGTTFLQSLKMLPPLALSKFWNRAKERVKEQERERETEKRSVFSPGFCRRSWAGRRCLYWWESWHVWLITVRDAARPHQHTHTHHAASQTSIKNSPTIFHIQPFLFSRNKQRDKQEVTGQSNHQCYERVQNTSGIQNTQSARDHHYCWRLTLNTGSLDSLLRCRTKFT